MQLKSFTLHMNNLISQYGNVVMVNLINKTGYEGPMGDEFVKHVQLLNDARVKYVSFELPSCKGTPNVNTTQGTHTLISITNAVRCSGIVFRF